jgi:chitosanase
MNDLQKKTAQAIVNIFETSKLHGDYAAVVLIAGDTGHLSYGRSQTTLAGGGLFTLIHRYCKTPGAQYADALRPFLDRLQAKDFSLDNDRKLRSVLKQAGADPVMQQVQDQFFDKTYWATAQRFALTGLQGAGVTTPLGIATIYDSVIHGSFPLIKKRTNASFPTIPDERDWVAKYVEQRRAWLANHTNPILRKCVYRMDAFAGLIAADKWRLELPMTIRGVEITDHSFDPPPPPKPTPKPPPRPARGHHEVMLSLRTPFQTGEAVKYLQRGLAKAGLMPENAVDGVFGPATSKLVKTFQKQKRLTPDGIVGKTTWSAVHKLMPP